MPDRIRFKPGAKYIRAIPEELPENDTVEVLGIKRFYEVVINGNLRGYVSENFVESNEDQAGAKLGDGLTLKK
jgi:hypothetical protein